MTKDDLIRSLAPFNFWYQPLPSFRPRHHYLDLIHQSLQTHSSLFLHGLRSTGKTTLAFQYFHYLFDLNLPRINTLYLDLSLPLLQSRDLSYILNAYLEILHPQCPVYLVLDHLSSDDSFQLATSLPSNFKIIFISHLRLTYPHSLLVSPPSFIETLSFSHLPLSTTSLPTLYHSLRHYLQSGPSLSFSLPPSLPTLSHYLQTLLKDLISHYNLKNIDTFNLFFRYLLAHSASPISTYQIEKELGLSNENARRYLDCLHHFHLIDYLPYFSKVANDRIYHPKTIYFTHPGLLQLLSPIPPTLPHLLHFIYHQLASPTLFYHSTAPFYFSPTNYYTPIWQLTPDTDIPTTIYFETLPDYQPKKALSILKFIQQC